MSQKQEAVYVNVKDFNEVEYINMAPGIPKLADSDEEESNGYLHPVSIPVKELSTVSQCSPVSSPVKELSTVSQCHPVSRPVKELSTVSQCHPVISPVKELSTVSQCSPGTVKHTPTEQPQPVKRKQPQEKKKKQLEVNHMSPSNNSLPGKTFHVYVEPFTCKKTPPSFGDCLLAINDGSIEMRSKDNKRVFLTWPLQFIRRYGFEENQFRFESGRRTESGEGNFVFITQEGKTINDEISHEINKRLQKMHTT